MLTVWRGKATPNNTNTAKQHEHGLERKENEDAREE